MPEGDTIHRAAGRLRKALEGQVLTSARGRREIGAVSKLTGQTVQHVEARGKHLMIYFDHQMVLHSHMGMTGSWHVYGISEPWRKPPHHAAIEVRTATACAVCFTPRLMELVTATTLRRNAWLQRLGPDLLGPPISDRALITRVRSQKHQPIGEVVMNQSVVSGIGNVYKSEILFLEQLHPLQPVSTIADCALLQLRDRTVTLMKRNLGSSRRKTRFRSDGSGVWVYGRQQEPCLICGDPICMIRQGDSSRSTYFCPNCQPLRKPSGEPTASGESEPADVG